MDDSDARAAALDPARSYLVQAPAGSGKTELLIQRYLALLATVDQPEQIVAITFTRKAAAEMRQRVQKALRRALGGETGTHAHERTTLGLARAAIERDTALDWDLLGQPQRLRIDTLDAFNIWLAHQLPVLADGVAAAGIAEKPDALYREAARRAVRTLLAGDSLAADVGILLQGVHNDTEQLERLLAALLSRRDSWLPVLAGSTPDTLRELLEAGLQRLVDDELAAAESLMTTTLLLKLMPLLRHAAGFAAESLASSLSVWLALERLPSQGPLALAAWRGIAALLLTKSGGWRKRISRAEGFGPEHKTLGEQLRQILGALGDNEVLRVTLQTVSRLPDAHYSTAQWRDLVALQSVLVHLAAELKVVFAEQQTVDFVELALAAQRALGHVDAPSELLLALDRRIQHLLVDEFQDTSRTQLRLLELLTGGWTANDGRSLFCVGDPMQSIYRFRDAEMSLFLRAKEKGLGSVPLVNLTLTRNFRSAPAIVDWINEMFQGVFPAHDHIGSGQAGFRASAAIREGTREQFVAVDRVAAAPFTEVERVVEILDRERQRDPSQSIAVLVQSRTHLDGLRERIHREGWAVHAVEIDTLGDRQVAQDLAGLTRALLHLDDRIAWLGVLRAPWCGLRWSDLEALVGTERRRPLWEVLHDDSCLRRMSDDGRRRAAWLVQTLDEAFARRDGRSLVEWVEHTWRSLGGEALLDGSVERHAATQFLGLLASRERNGDLDDPPALQAMLDAVQPQADPPREKGIEIMTMHRAKGLEFDTVVLLGLSREPRPDEPKALQWMTRIAADGRDDLLLVPRASDDDVEAGRLTDFVQRAERVHARAERARLLYVATTRARERLYVVWQLSSDRTEPPNGSALSHLWPSMSPSLKLDAKVTESAAATLEATTPKLRRLARVGTSVPRSEHVVEATTLQRPEFVWAGHAAAHVGTVVHRYLQRIAERGLATWTVGAVTELEPVFERELELLGVDVTELPRAAGRVVTALSEALRDPRGRWTLAPHAEARSELKLALQHGEVIEHLQIDRTFVEGERRWIIDFKTSQHEGGELASFLDSEVSRYAQQLDRYAHAMHSLDGRPVSVGLYFPMLREFRGWEAITASP